jgi:medium-chain acyl-[acyl-carrier-protein] hydrolase
MDKPFAFFGHSLGALMSFELARYLRRCYRLTPVHLFVSAHKAPQIPSRDRPIHALPDAEFVEELRQLNGMSKQVLESPELMQILLPILQADFTVCETYVYEDDSPLDCPISALGGLQDEYVSQESLEAWREHTCATFSLHMFPGDHFYLNTDRLLLLCTLARALIDPQARQRRTRIPGHKRMGGVQMLTRVVKSKE